MSCLKVQLKSPIIIENTTYGQAMPDLTIIVQSFSDIINELLIRCSSLPPMWFRGQADASWRLDCSLSREGGIDKEMPLIKRFKQNEVGRQIRTPNYTALASTSS